MRLQFEQEFFLKLKSGGAATIAVRPINGKIRYVSRGSVILCFEVLVVTCEEVLLKFAALGQLRKLA